MLKEVEVIAYFNLEGHARPYKLRVESDEGLINVNIDRILKENKMFRSVNYICECEMHGRVKEIEIFYKYEDLKWYVRT